MISTETIAANIIDVTANIAAAARAAQRKPGEVALVAVSKVHTIDTVRHALVAGHGLFGENRVQEAFEKWPILKEEFPDAKVHLIGPLQTNKTKEAVALFDAIETLDRPKLAKFLAREMDAQGRRPDCYIQINTGEEPQKAGILAKDADAFIRQCIDDLGLPVKGLMCIPPVEEEAALHFAFLREIASRNGLDGLSMGMSADYEKAIRFGATMVRVGTAIFGARPPRVG